LEWELRRCPLGNGDPTDEDETKEVAKAVVDGKIAFMLAPRVANLDLAPATKVVKVKFYKGQVGVVMKEIQLQEARNVEVVKPIK
jgi:hypothetical protein